MEERPRSGRPPYKFWEEEDPCGQGGGQAGYASSRTRGRAVRAGGTRAGAAKLPASSEKKSRSALTGADAFTHCFRIHADSTLLLTYNPSGLGEGWEVLPSAPKVKSLSPPNLHLKSAPSIFRRTNCSFIVTPSGFCLSMDAHTQFHRAREGSRFS